MSSLISAMPPSGAVPSDTELWEAALDRSELSLLSTHSSVEGKLVVGPVARLEGRIIGQIVSPAEGVLILLPGAWIEGEINGGTIVIAGAVQGSVRARVKIVLEPSAQVRGDLHAPQIRIEPGALFEGRAHTEVQS